MNFNVRRASSRFAQHAIPKDTLEWVVLRSVSTKILRNRNVYSGPGPASTTSNNAPLAEYGWRKSKGVTILAVNVECISVGFVLVYLTPTVFIPIWPKCMETGTMTQNMVEGKQLVNQGCRCRISCRLQVVRLLSRNRLQNCAASNFYTKIALHAP